MEFAASLLLCLSALSALANDPARPLSKDITIVYITDETIERYGSFPFNRKIYGDYINAVYNHYDPKVVYMDILIVDHNRDLPEGDAALAESVKGKKNLVFGAMVGNRKFDQEATFESAWAIEPTRSIRSSKGAFFPIKPILQNGARAGFVSIYLNDAGYYDTNPTITMIGNLPYPSAPLVLVEDYTDMPKTKRADFVKAILSQPDNSPWGEFKIDYDHRFSQLTMHDIIEGKADPDLLNGRIVLLGAYFSGGTDMKPIGRDYLIPGTEMLANATQTLLDAFSISAEGIEKK